MSGGWPSWAGSCISRFGSSPRGETMRHLTLLTTLLLTLAACQDAPPAPRPETQRQAARAGALADACAAADFVGLVEVTHVRAYPRRLGTDGLEGLWSEVTFEVIEAVADRRKAPGPELTLQVIGGAKEGRAVQVGHAPSFREGERAVLIARERGDGWPVWGGTRGALRVEQGRALSWSGAPVIGLTAGGLQLAPKPAPSPRAVAVAGSRPAERLSPQHTLEPMTVAEALAALRRLTSPGGTP